MLTACETRGVCPRLLLAEWTGAVISAMSWWENGALGLSFLDAPAWLHSAFVLISRERLRAHRYRQELKRQR